MDHIEYYNRAREIHKREKAAIDAIPATGIRRLIASKRGQPFPIEPTVATLVARHQAIVAEMVSLGEEFIQNT